MIEIGLLRRIQLFSRLSDDALAEVTGALETRQLEAKQVLFNMGEMGDELYVVRRGSVAIYVPSQDKPGEEQPIRIFGADEVLGEMALIDNQPRSASARALEASEVLVLTGGEFRQLLLRYPDMALAVMSGLNDRIRYTTDFVAEVRQWVKRVAEGEYDKQFSSTSEYQDRSIGALAAEFAQMAAQVQEREQELRRELVQLRVQVDQDKRKRQVEEIAGTDYFQALKGQAKKLRGQE